MYIAARLPVFNFFYFAFFDDATGPPPTRDDVSALANTIALVTALLFTIVAAVPMSVSNDDLQKWDWEYGATVSRPPLSLSRSSTRALERALALSLSRSPSLALSLSRAAFSLSLSLCRNLPLYMYRALAVSFLSHAPPALSFSLGCNRVRTDALD